MRKAILILVCLLLTVATVISQRKRTKPKSKPTATKSTWEKYTPCGVYYKDFDDFMSDFGKGWQFIGQTKSDHLWYDAERERCDKTTGVLKVWIKEMHRDTDMKYGLVLYELKCKTDELRVKSFVEYDKDGRVLDSREYVAVSWSDVIPDSAGEMILKTVCRRPY